MFCTDMWVKWALSGAAHSSQVLGAQSTKCGYTPLGSRRSFWDGMDWRTHPRQCNPRSHGHAWRHASPPPASPCTCCGSPASGLCSCPATGRLVCLGWLVPMARSGGSAGSRMGCGVAPRWARVPVSAPIAHIPSSAGLSGPWPTFPVINVSTVFL